MYVASGMSILLSSLALLHARVLCSIFYEYSWSSARSMLVHVLDGAIAKLHEWNLLIRFAIRLTYFSSFRESSLLPFDNGKRSS